MVDVDHFNDSPVSVVIAEAALRSPSFGEETFLSVAIRKQEDTSGNSNKNEDKNAARSSLRKSTGIDALHPLSDVIISSKNSRISSSPIGERNDSYRFSPSIWDSPISPPQHIDDLFGTSNPFAFTDMLRPSSKVSDYFDSAPEDDLADVDQYDDGYASPRRKLSEDGYESIFGMDPLYELSPDQSSPRTLTPDREPTGQLTGENSPYASTFGEHPLGEHPSRTLFVRNINSNVEDDELKSLFEQYGPIRSMYTACKHRGFVMISYYDIRHAKSAMRHLQGKVLRRRKLDIHYSIPKDNPSEKDQNQGTLVVFNLDPATLNEELKEIFQNYGEIKEVRETPNKKHHKFIEFYDVRDAEKAMKNLNKAEIRGKKIKIEPSRPGGARKMSQYYEQQYFDDDDTSSQQSFSGEEFSGINNSFPPAPKLKPTTINPPITTGSLNSNNVYRPIKSPPPTAVAQSPNYPRSPQDPGVFVPRNISPSPQSQPGIWSPANTTKGFNNSPSKSSPFSIIEQNGALKNTLQESRSSDGEGNGRSRSKRSDSNEDKSKFKLVVSKVADDGRTTLMIKNIPNKYNQKMLLSAVDEKHKGTYDFFYLPIDFKNKCNVGYAFINFVSCDFIVSFYQEFNGKKWEKFNSEKVCNIAYARIQGKQSLIQHFQNSSLMCEDKKCRPIIFHTLGPHVGEQEPFPVGPNVRRRGSDSSTDR